MDPALNHAAALLPILNPMAAAAAAAAGPAAAAQKTPKRGGAAAASGGSAKRPKTENGSAAKGAKGTPTSGGAKGKGKGKAGASPSCRFDSSLGLLTKKFVDLIQHTPDGNLDLNKAAQQLDVQKRRIYDITNVLEGIGLIEKTSKNNIAWQGSGLSIPEAAQEELGQLRKTIEDLRMQEIALDSYMSHTTGLITSLTQSAGPHINLRHGDIRGLECFKDSTVIAIKAPPGTTLEVPDPDEGAEGGNRRYQIYLRSAGGGIDVYLVSQLPEEIQVTHESFPPDAAENDAAAAAAAAAQLGLGTPTGLGPLGLKAESDGAGIGSASDLFSGEQMGMPSPRTQAALDGLAASDEHFFNRFANSPGQLHSEAHSGLLKVSPLKMDSEFPYSLIDGEEGISDFFDM